MTNEQFDDLDLGALRRLLDRHAIVDCVQRYARGVDRADEELVRSAYHADAEEDHGAFIGDIEGLLPFLASVHRPFDRYQRYVTNISVEIVDDEAHAESYWLCILRRDESGKLMVTGGRYVDRLERRECEWRIAARVVVSEWGGAVDSLADPKVFVAPRHDREDVSYQRPLRLTRERRAPTSRGAGRTPRAVEPPNQSDVQELP